MEICKICGNPIEDLAGDPGKWGMKVCRYLGHGRSEMTDYHISCVNKALDAFGTKQVPIGDIIGHHGTREDE